MQIENAKWRNNLLGRFLDFATNSIKLVVRLNKTAVGHHISGQLTCWGMLMGSNFEETRGAEIRADFIHKLRIVLKLKELESLSIGYA